MENKISIGLASVALLVAGGVAVKPDSKSYVGATQSEDDKMVTEVMQSRPDIGAVPCERKWLQDSDTKEQKLTWSCDRGTGDFAPPASWVAWLDKKRGSDGQKVLFDPKMVGQDISVPITTYRGADPERTPTIEELVALEPPREEKPIEKPAEELPK